MKHTKFYTTVVKVGIVLSLVIMGWMITSCNRDSTTAPVPASSMVNMAISFSPSGTSESSGNMGLLFTDSLHVDSADVVFSRIRFLHHSDSELVDSDEDHHNSDEHDGDERDESITFKGPFLVHVRDTVGINFANQELPAGTYDGIKFKIHRLNHGEHHEDSDEHNHHVLLNHPTIAGSSIMVWGSIFKNGEWTPFTFMFDGEFEFKIKGNFDVPASTNTVMIALNIDLGKWFRNPSDGSILDPTDTSSHNLRMIRRAIRASFGSGRGGHDRGDGHPDD